MDSKHRHELEQNELAKWLVAQYEDWIRPNSSWLGYAVLGVLIVVAILIGTARVNTWNQNAAWKHYYAALYSEQADVELEAVAQSTSGAVGVQARLTLAQRQLSEGCSLVFGNKKEAIGPLEKAITSFQQVQKATSDSLFLQQAGYGLGQCWEALAAARVGNDLAKAEEEYQKIIDRWGDGFKGKQAQKQLALIRQPATQEVLKLMAEKTVEDSETGNFVPDNLGMDDLIEPGQINLGLFDQIMAPEGQKTDATPEQESVEE